MMKIAAQFFHPCATRAIALCIASLLGACGGGDPSPVTPITPIQQMAAALSGPITRDFTQSPTFAEDNLLASKDQALFAQLPPPAAQYDRDIARLKAAAGIAPSVPIKATIDLTCGVPVGGGVTGYSGVVVDGKFFDILLDYSSYWTMAARGLPVDAREVALAKIVSYHNSLRCANYPVSAFLYGSNPQIASSTDTVARFDSMAGAILYHEYGHYWTWAALDKLRIENAYLAFGAAPFAFYPSKSEDEADAVSGILTKKSGHDIGPAMEMLDLMALYTLNRTAGMYPDITNIQSFQTQMARNAPQYSPLITRKALMRSGFDSYQ